MFTIEVNLLSCYFHNLNLFIFIIFIKICIVGVVCLRRLHLTSAESGLTLIFLSLPFPSKGNSCRVKRQQQKPPVFFHNHLSPPPILYWFYIFTFINDVNHPLTAYLPFFKQVVTIFKCFILYCVILITNCHMVSL